MDKLMNAYLIVTVSFVALGLGWTTVELVNEVLWYFNECKKIRNAKKVMKKNEEKEMY